MNEVELEELLALTNFSEKEKNRYRRLFRESDIDDRNSMRESLISQQGDDDNMDAVEYYEG